MAGRISAGARPSGTAPTTPTAGSSGPSAPSQPAANPPPAKGKSKKTGSGSGAGKIYQSAGTTAGSVASNGAGVILAFLVWGWVGLPFIQGGLGGVKDVIRAKFLNKAHDGSWLP